MRRREGAGWVRCTNHPSLLHTTDLTSCSSVGVLRVGTGGASTYSKCCFASYWLHCATAMWTPTSMHLLPTRSCIVDRWYVISWVVRIGSYKTTLESQAFK